MKLARNIGAGSLLIRSYLPARRVVAYQVVAMNSTALLAQFARAPISHLYSVNYLQVIINLWDK